MANSASASIDNNNNINDLTQWIGGLGISNYLDVVDATDTSLRFMQTTAAGYVKLYSSSWPSETLYRWKIKAYKNARGGGTPEYKGLAVLIQSGVTAVAKSGWSKYLDQDDSRDIFSPIKGSYWTEETLTLCKNLEFRLGAHWKDRGIEGRYLASHSVMQLITLLVAVNEPQLLNLPVGEEGADRAPVETALIITNRQLSPCYKELAQRVREESGGRLNIRIGHRGPMMEPYELHSDN